MSRKIVPTYPEEILLEEFLNPMKISQYRLAIDINVSSRRINEIVLEKKVCYSRYGSKVISVYWTL